MLYQYTAFKFIAENSHLYNWARERAASKVKKILSFLADLNKNSNQPEENQKPVEATIDQLSLALLKEIKKTTESAGAQHILLNVPKRVSRSEFKDTLPKEFREHFSVVNPP